MAQTQMTDRHPSGLGVPEELTDEELLAINGGGFFSKLFTPFRPKPSSPPDLPGLVKTPKLPRWMERFFS
jgi:hypothetical protein